jgi:hypothetical protein
MLLVVEVALELLELVALAALVLLEEMVQVALQLLQRLELPIEAVAVAVAVILASRELLAAQV